MRSGDDLLDALSQSAYAHMVTKRDRLFTLFVTSVISFMLGLVVGIWLP